MMQADIQTQVKPDIFAACGKIDVDDKFPAAIWTQLTVQNVALLSRDSVVRRMHKGSKRYLLYIRDENQVFIMGENCKFLQVSKASFWKDDHPLQNTLLDGRMHVSENRAVFVIYDIIQHNNNPTSMYQFQTRFQFIEINILRPRLIMLGLNVSTEDLVIELEPYYTLSDMDELVPFDQDKYSGLMFHDRLPYKCQLHPNWLVWERSLHSGPDGLTFSALASIIEATCQRASELSGEDKKLWEQCIICTTTEFKGYAVGWCNHVICMDCCAQQRAQQRVMKKNFKCCYCQQAMPVVLYSHDVPSEADVAALASSNLNKNCIFKDDKTELYYTWLIGIRCSVEKCLQKDDLFVNFWGLKHHVFQVHGLSPCHLCDDVQKADFLGNRTWANKSSNETYLSHLLAHHKMCYYCEFDCRKHNNWFADGVKLSEHEETHTFDMGEYSDSLDYDDHFLASKPRWQKWAEKYEEYQQGVVRGDTTKSTEFMAKENITAQNIEVFVNLPISRVHALENVCIAASQICHLCNCVISRQTTFTDMVSANKEYMFHLLSKHIMCFLCAWYKGIPNLWFANDVAYNAHKAKHDTNYPESFEYKQREHEFVLQLKLASTLFRRRYGGWRRVPIVSSTYYSEFQNVKKIEVTQDLPELPTSYVEDNNANYASAPCHLCVRNNDDHLVDKSTDEKNLSHLNEHHMMCYYCEFDCRKNNNWFANINELVAHCDIHDTEAGDEGTVYFDPHFSHWKSHPSLDMVVEQEVMYKNLPLSDQTVSGEIIAQSCHLCNETIRRETTLTDIASYNREYLRHLLSEHIMCFFCACYQDRPNVWFDSEAEYDAHCAQHNTVTLDSPLYNPHFDDELYIWKAMEKQFVHELKIVSTLFRRKFGEWRRVPLVSSAYYSDDPTVSGMDVFAGLPDWGIRKVGQRHPIIGAGMQTVVAVLISQGLIEPFPALNVVDEDFVQDPVAYL